VDVGTTKAMSKKHERQYAALLRLAHDQRGTPEGKEAARKAQWMYNTHIRPTLLTPEAVPDAGRLSGTGGIYGWMNRLRKKH
jgi:hypothetical protein